MRRVVQLLLFLLLASGLNAFDVGGELSSESAVSGTFGALPDFSQRARGELRLAYSPADPVTLGFTGG